MGNISIANRKYKGIPVGVEVRGTLGSRQAEPIVAKIYRIRRYANYRTQDCYDYFVPDSINNVQAQHSRDVFTAANAAWKVLTDLSKAWWDTEVKRKHLVMSGQNLFIRTYMYDNL